VIEVGVQVNDIQPAGRDLHCLGGRYEQRADQRIQLRRKRSKFFLGRRTKPVVVYFGMALNGFLPFGMSRMAKTPIP
jgi:hypothetical protein